MSEINLANRREMDDYLRKGEAEFDQMVELAREKDPFFYQKLADAPGTRWRS